MLVEINLLPKKEPKNVAFLVIIFSALLIVLVAGAIIFWQGIGYENKLNSLNSQIKATKKLAEIEQTKQANTSQASASLTQLESAVQWANGETLKSGPVFKHLVALLPERGFIQTITYAGAGTLTLTVQFDTSRDAAYFYKNLLDSKWISEAKLSSLSTSESKQTDSTDSAQTNTEIDQYIPRYTGQYEITVNRDFLSKEEKTEKSEEDKQGGDVS